MIRESIALCSVLKLSDEELERVTQACGLDGSFTSIDALRNYDPTSVLICGDDPGSEGAVLISEEEWWNNRASRLP